MKKGGREAVVDAGQEGHVVGGLEETEVVEDGFVGGVRCAERRVRADFGAESLLQVLLSIEEVIEEGELFGSDGAAIGTGGQEVVGVHRNEQGGVGVIRCDLLDGALTDGEVVGKVDLFECRIFADEFRGEGGWPAFFGDGGCSIAQGPTVVVCVDAQQHVAAWRRGSK